jgi:hypothetical protein
VQREREHVVAPVEDLLRAIAMVHVLQSITATRPTRVRAFKASMATAMLLSRQKPMAWSRRQWWPGGRVNA